MIKISKVRTSIPEPESQQLGMPFCNGWTGSGLEQRWHGRRVTGPSNEREALG
jgi:hypothetical protein